MAFQVAYNAHVTINGVDLSDHCTMARFNTGQETRDATAHGDSQRKFRPGLGTPSFEFTLFNDHASASVESTLRGLVSITSTGVTVTAKKDNAVATTDNPRYDFQGILDGDLMVLDDEVGELPTITARFVPYASSFNVITTATST